MKLIRRHPLAALFVSLYGWFGLTTATSVILAATGGETTGREAAVIAAVCVLSLTGMAVSCWLYRRHEQRRHE